MNVLYGGAFNPVHNAHVRTVIELNDALKPERFVILPTGVPALKAKNALAPTADRLKMLALALPDTVPVEVDDYELSREQTSYTIDTLAYFRQALGETAPIVFVIGYDNLISIQSWHKWEALLDYAHLVVTNRVTQAQSLPTSVADWFTQHEMALSEMQNKPAGGIALHTMPLLEIASSDIRTKVQTGRSIRGLVPDPVVTYINQHQLYTKVINH